MLHLVREEALLAGRPVRSWTSFAGTLLEQAGIRQAASAKGLEALVSSNDSQGNI